MANDVHTGPDSSLTSLVAGIIKDVQELLKQQLSLFREEVKDDVRKTKEAAISLCRHRDPRAQWYLSVPDAGLPAQLGFSCCPPGMDLLRDHRRLITA